MGIFINDFTRLASCCIFDVFYGKYVGYRRILQIMIKTIRNNLYDKYRTR